LVSAPAEFISLCLRGFGFVLPLFFGNSGGFSFDLSFGA
jgi:hypothetical protein